MITVFENLKNHMGRKHIKPRCCDIAMVSLYIKHGQNSPNPGLEKVGYFCYTCKKFKPINNKKSRKF